MQINPRVPCPFFPGQRIYTLQGYYRGVVGSVEYNPWADEWIGQVVGGKWWVTNIELANGIIFIGRPPMKALCRT